MGVSILDENGVWHEETNDSPGKRYDPSKPEMGERPREDRQRLPFPDVMPGLQEVPVTPTSKIERHKWHPGLVRTPVVPTPQPKKPIVH